MASWGPPPTSAANMDLASLRGNVPEGPNRWERARRNAIAKPHTQAAKLYKRRVNTGEAFAARYYLAPGNRLSVAVSHDGRTYDRKYFCGVKCAVMHLQLRHTNNNVELQTLIEGATSGGRVGLHKQIWRTVTVEQHAPDQVKAGVTCRVCGVQVGPDKPAKKARTPKPAPQPQPTVVAPAAPRKDPYIVTLEGDVIPADSVILVHLTAEVAELLRDYVDRSDRVDYANKHGESITC